MSNNIWSQYLNSSRLKISGRNTDNDPRNEFESDFGRIIFSPAIRRMHDKTQVFPLTTDDNIHSRLTHSMEVMSIGHSFGIRLCENSQICSGIGQDSNALFRQIPVILKNACLVHDIGNPPFGHFGETVIKEFFKHLFHEDRFTLGLSDLEKEDFTNFDGNAQGFRVLTKLQVLDNEFGLNLTLGTLAAFLKYPNYGIINEHILSQSKRGVFQSEIKYFELVANGCGLKKTDTFQRHPLSFLMEAADSICYLTMDIEDGFNKGWYDYADIKNFLFDIQGLPEVFSQLEIKHTGMGKEVAKIVGLRIYLIKRLVDLAMDNFIANLDNIYDGEYESELIKEDSHELAKALNRFCKLNIFPKREIQSLELTGHSVLSGLLDYYTKFIFGSNEAYTKKGLAMISDSVIRAALIEKQLSNLSPYEGFSQLSNYYKLRIIVDYISGMTDQYALNEYQKLSGQKII